MTDEHDDHLLKAKEARLRRRAYRLGLRRVKSRARSPLRPDFGCYGLIDPRYNGTIHPDPLGHT